jgi:hypothetical protein
MTTLFNYDPYYDDFDEDKNFMRVLFRPEYAVQARELTQLQTILANQIEKFGNHIFKSGSPIIGGKVSLDPTANHIILNSQYNNEDIIVNDFLNKTIISVNSSKRVRAKVIDTTTLDGYPTLVIKYLSGDRFAENEDIKVSGQELYGTLRTSDAFGGSYVASIQDGVYYFKGHFVKVTPQFLTIKLRYRVGNSAVTSEPSGKIGIEFEENIVDEVDDTSLLDPALGASNYQAPGAERFAIATTLSIRDLASADTSKFIEIIRMVDGVKTKELEYPIYSEIEKTLARRTYDESGNYTTDPFVISLEEGDSANGNFNVVLDPGKAYVGGYEFQTIAPTTIELARARDTASANNIDISTNYESYVAIKNIAGVLDITTFPSMDIHSVPQNQVNVSTTAAYNSTKIGTARASMMQYNDSTASDTGSTYSYLVNIFDVHAANISGTLASSGSSNTVIKLPASFSTTAGANAYANMYFRIMDSGGSSVSPILISESSVTANTVTLQTALPFVPSSNTFSIESDFRNAESFVIKSSTSKTFAANVDSDSKETTTGFAFVTEPKKNALIFDTPYTAIAETTIDNMDFTALKNYGTKTTDGSTDISIQTSGAGVTRDSWPFSSISDSIIRDNIICVVNNGSATNTYYGITANTILALSNNIFTVAYTNQNTLTINLNNPAKDTGATYSLTFFVKTKINNAQDASSGVTKDKILIPLTTGANLHAKVPSEMGGGNTLDAANTSGSVTAVSGTGAVFTSIGATNFDDATILKDLRTPGKAVSIQVPDVYEIVKIVDSKSLTANVTTADLTNAAKDITSSYEFDNGQKKTHYDHATLKLKRGYSSPTGRIFVQYKYLQHQSGLTGLFTVDSYTHASSNFTYGEIPIFNNKEDSKTVSLRSAFDFRPTRTIGDSTLSGALNPITTGTIETSFDYYLSRIDQIVVKPSREFQIIGGKSSVNPSAPNVNRDDMLIYTLYIPAYTESVKDIRADFKNHRRYTMSDIGAFENRIKQLEYYVSLNSLEKDAASTKIIDSNGLERSKYGIVVDNFTSDDLKASRQEVGDDNRHLIESGELKPASLMRTVKMKANNFTATTAKFSGVGDKQVVTLNYTSSQLAAQPFATKSLAITDALYANFKGLLRLFPEFSGDVDSDTTARVTLNSSQGLDNTFNFINGALKYISDNNPQWNVDIDSPFAQVADSSWYQTRSEIDYASAQSWVYLGWVGAHSWGTVAPINDNTYLTAGAQLNQRQITTTTSQQNVGEFVTDLAIQPYMKPKQILFTVNGLRPSTTVYSFFDDVDVNEYIIVPNRVTLNANTTLISGEPVLIANTSADLAANIASLRSGGTNFSVGFIVVSESGTANVSIVNESGKTLASKNVWSISDGTYYKINSVIEHRSGVGSISSNTIILQSDASSANDYYNSNTLTFVRSTSSFDGVGEQFTITDYDGVSKIAYLSSTPTSTGSVVYSIGINKTNKVGEAGGAFYMPRATFRSGQRNFRVSESFNNTYDADSVSFADKTYVSSGINLNKTQLINTVYNFDVDFKIVGTQTTDRLLSSNRSGSAILARWYTDPLAQTFYVDPQVYPNGVFVDSIDLFFRAKDDELPVTIQIRPTVNGTPSSDYWYPESVVVKQANDINVSDTPSVDSASTKTNFKFYSPVYLQPGLFAIVVLSDSPDYTVWEAEKGQRTTDNEFVSINPYVGTLYKSQNTMEYVPYINEDLMFVINRCVFSTTPVSVYFENEQLSTQYNVDKIRLLETSIVPAGTKIENSLITRTIDNVYETSYRGISSQQTISFETDDLYVVGSRRKIIEDRGDFKVKIDLSTESADVSPVLSVENSYMNIWENFIDNAEINSGDIAIVAAGTGYGNSNVIVITSSTGTGFTSNVSCSASGNITSIIIDAVGSGYIDDFTVSIGANSAYPAVAASGSGAEIVVNSEYDSSGGPCLARYITKPIILADGFDAGDLRVFVSINKPSGTDVDVFYKLKADTDETEFKDVPYQKLVCINPTNVPSSSPIDFRDFEFRPSSTVNAVTYTSPNGITYDTFKTFSIKIVMRSIDGAVYPRCKDLRIIAVPAE